MLQGRTIGFLVRLLTTVAVVVVLALAPAWPAAALSPGYTILDAKTGCPIFVPDPTHPSQTVPELTPPHGEHCVQLSTPQVIYQEANVNGGCAGSLFVQEAIPPGIDNYALVVYSDIGIGSQWKGPPGQQSMQIEGGAATYTAPSGSKVWGLGGGAGGGPCTGPGDLMSHLKGAAAWGVTYKWLVSGTVTAKGPGAQPASNVAMSASCPSGGQTTTDDSGYYQFLLDSGPCTIEPHIKPGDTPTPPRRVVNVQKHDIQHVDFQIPCDALPDPADPPRTTAALSAEGPHSGGKCPLSVALLQLEPGIAGLSYIGRVTKGTNDETSMSESPVFVRQFDHPQVLPSAGTPSKNGGKPLLTSKCLSGCTDLLVTVTWKGGEPVADASVTATATAVQKSSIATYPQPPPNAPPGSEVQPGDGYLCGSDTTQTPVWMCAPDGLHLTGLTTNKFGQVLLRYWSPGLFYGASTHIRVRAAAGPDCGCLGWGTNVSDITIKPDLIFDGMVTGTDADKLDRAIEKWANPPSLTDFLSNPLAFELNATYGGTPQDAATNLIGAYVPPAGSVAISAAQWIAAYGASWLKVGYTALEQDEIVALAELFDALHVKAYGLGETSWTGAPSQPINPTFLQELAGAPTGLHPPNLSFRSIPITLPTVQLAADGGMLWVLGQVMKSDPYFDPDFYLQMYEISFCQQENVATCDQPYLPRSTSSGIESYIYLSFTFRDPFNKDSSGKLKQSQFGIAVPYNALAWMQAQFGADSAPQPAKAPAASH